MNDMKALGLALLSVTVNGLIGHFFAPTGIMLTPIVLTITTFLVCLKTKNIKVFFLGTLSFLFVALNDILIKLYSGGEHDNEGYGWMHLLLFMGLVPTTVILFTTIFRRKDEKCSNKLIACVFFIVLTYGMYNYLVTWAVEGIIGISGMTEKHLNC